MKIEDRIKRLEKPQVDAGRVPGTMITRVLAPEKGWEWGLGIGGMHMPKHFYTGKSLGECLTKAEAALL